MQTDTELLLAAHAGDEEAFEEVVYRYSGLIWQGYKRQTIRTSSQDWYHEARIVLFQCLHRINDLKWGVLTVYYQRALIHHPITLWRQEEKKATNAKEAVQTANVGNLDCYVLEPELQLHLFCREMRVELQPDQYQLLRLRVMGYSISECAKLLEKSKSWCYLTMKEIRLQCDRWTR